MMKKVYRPGLKACEELGIISPLANNELTKRNQKLFKTTWYFNL